MTDNKEFAKQMRENAVKNEQGNIVCSPELWEEIASVIEKAIIPPCKVGDKVYLPCLNDWGDIENYTIIKFVLYNDGLYLVVNDEDGEPHPIEDIGIEYFLTKEEAEEKLKELGK